MIKVGSLVAGLFTSWGAAAAKKVVQSVIDGAGTDDELATAEAKLAAIDAQAAIGQQSARPFLQYVGGAVMICYLIVTVFGLLWNAFLPEAVEIPWLALYSDAYLLLLWAFGITGVGHLLRTYEKQKSRAENPPATEALSQARQARIQRPARPVQRRPEIERALAERRRSAPQTLLPASQAWQWSERSRRRLSRAHPDLQTLFDWLLPRSPYDLTIGETTRAVETQRQYLQQGTTKIMDSRHLERPAMAVDFYVINPVTKKAIAQPSDEQLPMYVEVLELVKTGSEELGIAITSGGLDWGWDFFHIELDRSVYPRQVSVLDELDMPV